MSAWSKSVRPKPMKLPVISEVDNGHITITLYDRHTAYDKPGGLSGSIPCSNTCGELARVLCQYPNCTFEIKDKRTNKFRPDDAPRKLTFRIFRRSENRNNFGHREYFLMSREGIGFKACRVYDLPLNGEVEVVFHPRGEMFDWAAHGFECPERLKKVAPKKLIEEVFAPKAVEYDKDKLVLA